MKLHFLTLSLLFFSSSIFAQVYVKSDAAGGNDGSSWANAYTSLATAIENAPAESEIWVAGGIYKAGEAGADPVTTYFHVDKPLYLYGGFAGDETTIDQRDLSANETILSGDLNGDDIPNDFLTNRTDNGFHVVLMDLFAADGSIFDGFTVEGGAARYGNIWMGADESEWFGGGILSLASCEIRNCTFQQNGGGHGSALNTLGGAEVVIENCSFENNDGEFGTLRMDSHFSADVLNCNFSDNSTETLGAGAFVSNASVRFEGCIFEDNTCTEQVGGGVFVSQNIDGVVTDPVVEFKNCSFTNNTALVGGGLVVGNTLIGTQLSIEDCTFDGNTATAPFNGAGGALIVQNNSAAGGVETSLDVSVRRCSFSNNIAEEASGGIILCTGSELTAEVDSCQFLNNLSDNNAAGLQLLTTEEGRLDAVLNNLLFSENTSTFAGGGLAIINGNPEAPLTFHLANSMFTGNSGGLGGGLSLTSADANSAPGPIGTIEVCNFEGNSADGCCGAIFAAASELQIRDCNFEDNDTEGFLYGGGAIGMDDAQSTLIERSSLIDNASGEEEGGAIYLTSSDANVMLDNVLITGNEGPSSIYNEDSLTMRNVTMVNLTGLVHEDDGHLTLQNCIFANVESNYDASSDATATSLGGNLSNDNSMSSILTGANGYDDFNETAPFLDDDFVPLMGSPCVDTGNPDGIDADATDAAGEMRFQGTNIDIGALESPFIFSSTFNPVLDASVSVSPNPFSAVIRIETEEEPMSIQLFDVTGRLVDILPVGKPQVPVNESLASGIYFLEMQFEEGVVSRKVMKN